ncbi:MAG: hypothetical protein EPO13_08685 [Actinomycetota bacterium]|nr:MAG: hypothetical protein EPO13_08685 [Actinomycetota bacterium]
MNADLVPNDDIIEWFAWHDGSESPRWALPGSCLVATSLAESLGLRNEIWDVATDLAADGLTGDRGTDMFYRREWLPIASTTASGGPLVVVLDGRRAEPPILRVQWDNGESAAWETDLRLADIVRHWTKVLQTGRYRFSVDVDMWVGNPRELPPELQILALVG